MSIFKKEYTIHVEKMIDESKALFEKAFQNMAKKGYSDSTVIYHPSYGSKKFIGTIDDNGIYKARLIVSHETDAFYRSAPVNEIAFTGDDACTKVKVSIGIAKYGILFLCIIAVAIALLCISMLFIEDLTTLIPLAVAAAIIAAASTVPLFIAKQRISAAKETLIYILKYNDK